jgi:hypothetical protein
VLPRLDEQLANHPRTFSIVLLHELGTADADEAAVGVVGDGAGEERLSGSGRAIEEDTLRLGDAEGVEEFGVLDGQLDDLLDLLDLLIQAADHLVRRVGDLLDHHERDERVLLCRQDRVDLVCGREKRQLDILPRAF